jgi:hypothetical protein
VAGQRRTWATLYRPYRGLNLWRRPLILTPLGVIALKKAVAVVVAGSRNCPLGIFATLKPVLSTEAPSMGLKEGAGIRA